MCWLHLVVVRSGLHARTGADSGVHSVPLLKETHSSHTYWRLEGQSHPPLIFTEPVYTLIKTREVLWVGRESVGEIEGVLS